MDVFLKKFEEHSNNTSKEMFNSRILLYTHIFFQYCHLCVEIKLFNPHSEIILTAPQYVLPELINGMVTVLYCTSVKVLYSFGFICTSLELRLFTFYFLLVILHRRICCFVLEPVKYDALV